MQIQYAVNKIRTGGLALHYTQIQLTQITVCEQGRIFSDHKVAIEKC